MLVIWNVLATPRRLMISGDRPVMSSPRKRTRPAVGAWSPVITLKSVDLPTPFGPLTEQISPGRTSDDTPLRAASAPKWRDRPSTASIGADGLTTPLTARDGRTAAAGPASH